MATVTAYPQFTQKLGTKTVNLSTDACKVILLSAYTYAASHATLTDVLAAGTQLGTALGYTSGGVALTSVTYTTPTTGNVTTLAAANVTGLTCTARYIVVVDTQGGTNATSYPIMFVDLGAATLLTPGVTWSASGIMTWQT